jgi:hypothetical protein
LHSGLRRFDERGLWDIEEYKYYRLPLGKRIRVLRLRSGKPYDSEMVC